MSLQRRMVEEAMIEFLQSGKNVYIENGAANDRILGYHVLTYKTHAWQSYMEENITFETSACIFPRLVSLDDYEVDTEVFEGNLFVRVW